MIRRLFETLFGRSLKATASSAAQQPSVTNLAEQDDAEFGRWLAADHADNPFGLEGFDCRGFCQSMVSTTSDPRIAESFPAERRRMTVVDSDMLPEGATETPCDLTYPYRGDIAEGALCKASAMEEKWDIYLHADRLYFCRSWTGQPIYVARFTQDENIISICALWTAGDLEFSRRQIDFLIRSHLFWQPAPHPLPDELPRDPKTLALYSFSQYGRYGGIGMYGDTTQVEAPG
jgi:hypothetical protein